MFDSVYVIPSFKCNLKCPHCDIRFQKSVENIDCVVAAVKDIQSRKFVLFGGEPFINTEYVEAVCQTGKMTSISTNLVDHIEDVIRVVHKYDVALSTSWNVKRFSSNQYRRWINHLRLLAANQITTTVLITMTDDLIVSDPKVVFNVLDDIADTKAINSVLFEPLVASSYSTTTDDLDRWMFNVDSNWRYDFANAFKTICHAKCCNNIATILPDGVVRNGCPEFTKHNMISECLDCENSPFCKPCVCLTQCRMPKRFIRIYHE